MDALVIGGTRNLGPGIVSGLIDAGYRVTVVHRGVTRTDLPSGVEELLADRSDESQLGGLLHNRTFDVTIDMTLYNGADAAAVTRLFAKRTRRYIMVSTGQVYLVRLGAERPFRESDYEGPTMAPPPVVNQLDYKNWLYGVDKRAAEDVLMRAHKERGFPATVLRLPMVNSERDHVGRIHGYVMRLRDGGPILVPRGPHLPLRHIYGGDVARAIVQLAVSGAGLGKAYNLSQDESVSLEEFLAILGDLVGVRARMAAVPLERLMAEQLVPDCSPFSDPWMSALDNQRSKDELGMQYTPLPVYLPRLVEHLSGVTDAPSGYGRRRVELQIAEPLEARQLG